MDKLRMRTPNKADENFRALAAMFPSAVTETTDENGEVVRAVDKDVLMQEISCKVVDGCDERYQFTWPDKRKAVLLANAPTDKTLRPCREESADFDGTQNLYIEGDNLEVLKLLHETYLGKVKMIYIDPPYNTGNDFVYGDNFAQDAQTYRQNMMYPRLRLARDLLSDDGVIFISIDDNEVENLKKICNEIFGEGNFVAQLIWERAYSPKNDAKFISNSHDYVLMYTKSIENFKIGRLPRTEEANARYSNPDNDPRGIWKPSDISVKTYNAENDYPITTPSWRVVETPAGRCWSLSRNAFRERLADNRIWFGEDGNSVPRIKRFLSELKFDGMAPTSILFYKEVGHSQEGAQEVAKILDGGFFNGPKPQRLLKRLLTLANLDKDSIILDFFSGSATTAHSVMQLNAEDGGNRRFIMVQLPEACGENSEAFKAGYRNICEIGKERIRRAGAKIKEEAGLSGQSLDTGFRVLRLDSSNMRDVYCSPQELVQKDIAGLMDNVKGDRTPLDLLFQVMLELGIMPSSRIEETTIVGKKVFDVANGYLIACFDSGMGEAAVTEIAKKKPHYFVMRDPSGTSDGYSLITNFEQIFATYSPDTVRRVM